MNGNDTLIAHIEALLDDAKRMDFDDMQSSHTYPKMYLVSRLETLLNNTKNGKYD